MRTEEQLSALFKEWEERVREKEPNAKFCRDSVHYRCPDIQERYKRWNSAPTRVLFMGKDTNAGSCDIAEDWSSATEFGNRKYAVCQYLYIKRILGQEIKDFTLPNNVIETFFKETPFCWINVKKSAGKSTANRKEIAKHLEVYGDLLLREIELLKPTHIVCLCGDNNGAIADHLKKLNYQPVVYGALHPAAFLRSTQKKYESLKQL